MSDLSSRLKQTLQHQELNLKFMELLNTNRNIESIKDRQIVPAVPLNAFGNHVGLPSIHAQKQKMGSKLRSMSQVKIKMGELGVGGIVGLASRVSGKDSEYLGAIEKNQTSSMKNLIKIRNKSLQSAQRPRAVKQQPKLKRPPSKKQLAEQPPGSNPLLHGPSSIRSIIQITPQKLKLDLPSETKTGATKNTKLLSNKTIQQISSQAMDSLMLNIKFGKIQENISYRSYLKRDIQPTPAHIMKRLEQWANKYKIKSGLVYTRNLHNVFSRKCIANEMILAEFANYTQLRRQLEGVMPGLQYYPQVNREKGRHLAATKIQSLLRMNFDIKYTKKLKSLMQKVKVIQRYWRVALAYRRGREQLMDRLSMKIEKVKQLTSGMVKNWEFIKSSPRVEVHVCAIALEEFKRLSIGDLQQREVAQLTRIFKAVEPDCTVVYVSPFAFSGQIVRYYERIFQFGKKADSFRDRLYFVSVEKTLNRISNYLTTVSALIYDHQALNKIRQIIKDRQSPVMGQTCAYIVPSYPSNQYTNLASQLDIPVFSSSQSLYRLHSTKSGHYEFLKPLLQSLGEKSPFELPKTVHSIYSQKQLITVLAVLIHKNKDIKKWMFKIDDEVNGRGLAVFNVDSLAFLRELRKQEEEDGQDVEEKDVIGLIADQLKVKLKAKLKILHKSVYPDYNTYLSHFLTRGGFLQACIEPQTKEGKTSRPIEHSISFRIEPNGQFQILMTYSRLELGYKAIGSTIECPSELSAQEFDNEKVVRALYRHIWTKNKLFGYFTADFLCVRNPGGQTKEPSQESNGRRYLIGLDCFLNEKTSSILVPSMTSQCEYNKQTNRLQRKEATQLDAKGNLANQSFAESIKMQTQQSMDIPENKPNPRRQLYYLYCPFLKLYSLPSIPQYFKQCKFNNISFDIQSKLGTLFLLQGGLENGSLGFLCVSDTRDKMREEALRLVEFLSREYREVGKKDQKMGYKAKQSSDQIGQLRGYLLNVTRKKTTGLNLKKEDLNLQLIF